jgi:hypothetical protein
MTATEKLSLYYSHQVKRQDVNRIIKSAYSTLVTIMSITTIYPVITMPSKYPSFRALLWLFNGYYNSPDISIYFLYPTGIVITREYCTSYC